MFRDVLFALIEFSCSRNAFSSPRPSLAEPANEPGLHHLSQQRVAQQHDGQIQPEQRRERDKPERGRQRRHRQPGAGGDDNYGCKDERPTRPALDERDFVGANNMNDERLGEERLHKPAGVEQGRVVPAVEHVQHHEERQECRRREDDFRRRAYVRVHPPWCIAWEDPFRV